VVVVSFVLAGVIAMLGLDGYLRWQDPVGYRNLSSCTTIEPGATLEQVKAALGEPVAMSTSRGMTWVHFRTASIAAGPIRAAVQPSTGKVLALRCSEDGPDTWSLVTTATAQPSPADLRGILQAVAAIRDGQGKVGGGPWHITAGAAAAIELARAANIPHRFVSSSGQTRCVDGDDVTVDVQSDGRNAARVIVGLTCLKAPGSTFRRFSFDRNYEVVRVGDKWIARFEGFSITMPGWPLPNFAFEGTAGSHSLAAAAQRGRWTDEAIGEDGALR
jgi:hypothetical protein